MIALTELDGFLVLTAINRREGEATSETYALKSVSEDANGAQRLAGTSEDGDDYVVTVHQAGREPEPVQPYRELLAGMIAADVPCADPGCRFTVLQHLTGSLTPEQRELVRSVAPSFWEI